MNRKINPAQQAAQKARKEVAMQNAEIKVYVSGKPALFYTDELVEDTNGNIGRIVGKGMYGRINVAINGKVKALFGHSLTVVKSPYREL